MKAKGFSKGKNNLQCLCVYVRVRVRVRVRVCVCVCVCSGELAEVQALYRQSTEHGAQQSHLIKQLEGLNLDTQMVLRNQEEAHSVDTTSYQRVSMDRRAQDEPEVPPTADVDGLVDGLR